MAGRATEPRMESLARVQRRCGDLDVSGLPLGVQRLARRPGERLLGLRIGAFARLGWRCQRSSFPAGMAIA